MHHAGRVRREPPTQLFLSSRRRHTRYPLVTGVQTGALPILDRAPRPRPPAWGRRSPPPTSVREIGRASCRERVQISVVAVSLKKKNNRTDAKSVAEGKSVEPGARRSSQQTL